MSVPRPPQVGLALEICRAQGGSRRIKTAAAMQFGLTEEQEMIVSTVRSFVENEIYPHEALVERTGEVPPELAAEIKA